MNKKNPRRHSLFSRVIIRAVLFTISTNRGLSVALLDVNALTFSEQQMAAFHCECVFLKRAVAVCLSHTLHLQEASSHRPGRSCSHLLAKL